MTAFLRSERQQRGGRRRPPDGLRGFGPEGLSPAITCRSALKAERQHQTGSCRSSFGTDWAVSALSQVVWVKATPQLAIF